MTYTHFKQLWTAAGLNDQKSIQNPIMVDEMAPHTIDALVAASEGDFAAFDKIEKTLQTLRC